jgi:hypothetical protein
LESSRRGGGEVHGLGPMTFELSVQKFLNIKLIFFTEKFGEIGMCLLGCCWKDLDEQDLMEFIW